MIKTTKAKLIIAVMMILAACYGAFAAEPESNASKATFGEIWSDVDYFFNTGAWKDWSENVKFFAFSRLGANIPRYSEVELGVAANPGIYFAVYYKGKISGNPDGDSYSGKYSMPTTGTGDDTKYELINVKASRKANPNATYGALVGLAGGIKFTFEDTLEIKDSYTTPNPDYDPADPDSGPEFLPDTNTSTGKFYEIWKGTLTPSIQIGNLGPLSKLGFSMPIVYNRTESIKITDGSGITYSTFTTVPTGDTLLSAEGNYVQPDIYLRLILGNFWLDNDLSLKLYGVPSYGKDGKAATTGGVANVISFVGKGDGIKSQLETLSDKRFNIGDTVTPMYNIAGENGKINYSVTAALPVTVGLTTHDLRYTIDADDFNSTGSAKSVEVPIYKGSEFALEVEPAITAGVQYKPAELFSLQGGVEFTLFNWKMVSKKTEKVDAPKSGTDEETAINGANSNLGVPSGYSTDGTSTTSAFIYPKLTVGAGFTLNFKAAALDFVFVQEINPSLAGTIYSAVGNGLGNSQTSVVLTLKF